MSALASLERFGEEDPFFINTVYKVQTNEYLSILSSKWNFIIAELEIFCKRIKSQQSDLPEILFSKKNQRNETMKNEANQRWLFLEN